MSQITCSVFNLIPNPAIITLDFNNVEEFTHFITSPMTFEGDIDFYSFSMYIVTATLMRRSKI